MELAKEILKKEIERREILLKAETFVLTRNYLKAEIHNLKESVKKLTLGGVVKQSEQLKCNHNLVRQGHYIVCRKKDCSYKILG